MKQLVEQDGINKNPWFRKRSNNGELFLECWSNLWAWVCTSSTNAYKSIHAYYHYRWYIRYIWDTGGAPTIHSHCWKVFKNIYKPDSFHGYKFFCLFLSFNLIPFFCHLIYSLCRWDVNRLEELPKYMKLCFLCLINEINQIGYIILRDKGFNAIPYLKKSVRILAV